MSTLPQLVATKLVLITPEMAAEWLTKNTQNRHARKTIVAQYARDMKAGKWHETHQGIAFDRLGNLVDGQHRLMAIVASGVSVMMMVTTGLEPECRVAVDAHAKRLMDDRMVIAGHADYTRFRASAVNIISISRGGAYGRSPLTADEALEIWKQLKPGLMYTTPLSNDRNQRAICTGPLVAAIAMAWFYEQDIDRLTAFMMQIQGKEMPNGDRDFAAFSARNQLVSGTTMQHKNINQRVATYAKLQHAIHSFMRYEKRHRFSDAQFHYPYPIDAARCVRAFLGEKDGAK